MHPDDLNLWYFKDIRSQKYRKLQIWVCGSLKKKLSLLKNKLSLLKNKLSLLKNKCHWRISCHYWRISCHYWRISCYYWRIRLKSRDVLVTFFLITKSYFNFNLKKILIKSKFKTKCKKSLISCLKTPNHWTPQVGSNIWTFKIKIRPGVIVETKLLNRSLRVPGREEVKNTHDEYESEYSLSEYSLSEYSLPDSSPSLRGGVNLFRGLLCITEIHVFFILINLMTSMFKKG